MISIIVPIYNVEKYLEDCLLSIQNQTYQDFECIMVNDGSTDSSAEIAQKFTVSDSRFKLIHQENCGQSVARNIGICHVRGEYFTFVDSDDLIHTKYLEVLLENINGVDIAELTTLKFLKEDEINLTKDYKETIEKNYLLQKKKK